MHSSAQNCVVIRHSGQVLTRLCTAWQLIKPDNCTPVHAAVSDAIMQRDGPLALLQRALPPDQMCMADWYLLRRVRLTHAAGSIVTLLPTFRQPKQANLAPMRLHHRSR